MPDIGVRLQRIARLAATRVAAADYAATCARPDDGECLVAVGHALPDAVEDAVTGAGLPHSADGTTSMMSWPGFRDTAAGMGLRVVSAPLFTGGGTAVATLDLYGRDSHAIASLTAGVSAAFDTEMLVPTDQDHLAALDSGSQELVNGLAEAQSVRETIQLALTLMAEEDAYAELRLKAAEQGVPLLAAASAVIADAFSKRF